jgi:hypothetical protein
MEYKDKVMKTESSQADPTKAQRKYYKQFTPLGFLPAGLVEVITILLLRKLAQRRG